MQQNKPSIFISSTVYDFRDLRSALKYWLEELGYQVLLSEYNDFSKPIDENSYKACLKAIENADYFILLVGARTGGFVNTGDKVSITREEYRTAYELVKAGKMKLITFVRRDLWNIKEDRKELERYLTANFVEENELTDSDAQKITNHQSGIAINAEATFSFLDEIARKEEMKKAVKEGAEFPISNWIHQFETFQDIIETLNTILRVKTPLTQVALMKNLEIELLSNLSSFLIKKNNNFFRTTMFYKSIREKYTGGLEDSTKFKRKELKSLAGFLFVGDSINGLSTQFTDQALNSGLFLHYNSGSNT